MSANPDDPFEVEGVLNPGTCKGPDGDLYMYPRVVAAGNVSRIARTRVEVEDGVPVGVERLGIAMSPDAGWERGRQNAGVEDPRITFVEPLGLHVMTYVAYGPLGPKTALAVSRDSVTWERLGPIHFEYQPELNMDLNLFANKDVVFFPEAIPGPGGRPMLAVLHRPMWDLGWLREGEGAHLPDGILDERPSIWIGYIDLESARNDVSSLTSIRQSAPLVGPSMWYEEVKVGAGPSPFRVPEGWLLLHHGVSGAVPNGFELAHGSMYAAGGIILDYEDPRRVVAHSAEPLMVPEADAERTGTLGNVVFPTAIERVGDRTFVFYGMADSSIGIAELCPAG